MTIAVTALSILCAAMAAAVLYLYVGVIRAHLRVADDALDKQAAVADATSAVRRLDARLAGWKTIILAWIAGVAQVVALALPDILPQVQSYSWAPLVGEHAANVITIACTLLIPIVHARGLAHAATAVPADPNA